VHRRTSTPLGVERSLERWMRLRSVERAAVVRYLKRRKRNFCKFDKRRGVCGVFGLSSGSGVGDAAVVGFEGTVVLVGASSSMVNVPINKKMRSVEYFA
jgi:hypothetical protein